MSEKSPFLQSHKQGGKAKGCGDRQGICRQDKTARRQAGNLRARQNRTAGASPRPTAWREFVVYDFPQVCRARVLTAPGMRRQAGDLRARQNPTAGASPRPTGRRYGDAAPCVRSKIKLHGRPAGRPYDLTGIGIYDFVRNFRKAVGRGLDPAAAQFGRRGFGVCRTRTRCM